jgi:radical SAM-linked protein
MKVRFRFVKLGRIRWTSHRDVARMWERALRRAGLPVAYTGGFSPRPQLSFGLALPTGCESSAEYLDAAFSADFDVEALPRLLDPLLPLGVDVSAAAPLEPGTPSLQEEVTSCTWEIEVPGLDSEELGAVVERVLGSPSLPVRRERKGRLQEDDLRPAVLGLGVLAVDPGLARAVPAGDGACAPMGSRLGAELSTRPRGVRPSELAEVLGLELGLARRTCQWIECSGSRREPLAAAAASPDPVLGRAS